MGHAYYLSPTQLVKPKMIFCWLNFVINISIYIYIYIIVGTSCLESIVEAVWTGPMT